MNPTAPTDLPQPPGLFKTLAIFMAVALGIFTVSLVMNLDHLGINAAIHWDARTAVCSADPMPDKQQLMDARGHVFDAANSCTDPRAATYYFNYPTIPNAHVPLETVRKYYSQVATVLARKSYILGEKWTGTPTGGILFFQLSAAIAMAVAVGVVATIGITAAPAGTRRSWMWPMLVVFLIAVAGEPVMLSLSRQMLTEPAGYLFLAGAWATVAWFYRPTTSTASRIVLAAVGAVLFFLTVRTRYSLAVPLLLVTPLVILLNVSPGDLRRRWRSYLVSVAVTAAVAGILVFLDFRRYGPFILPTEYQRLLVRSTWLYFHVEPPFDNFWTAVYVNGPLLLLPVLVVGCGLIGWLTDSRQRIRASGLDRGFQIDRQKLVLFYGSFALLGLTYFLARTGAQQVGYQPRHLFPFSAGFVSVALMIFPRVRWRWATALPVAILCLLITAANIASTLGPQRTTMAEEFPPVVSAIMRQRKLPGFHRSLWRDLLAGYCDWADNRRLHDSLAVLEFLRTHSGTGGKNGLLIVDESTEGGWWIRQAAAEVGQPVGYWRADSTEVQDVTRAQISAAISSGNPVFFCRSRSVPVRGLPFPHRTASVSLDVSSLELVGP